jgi:hypothetical protein
VGVLKKKVWRFHFRFSCWSGLFRFSSSIKNKAEPQSSELEAPAYAEAPAGRPAYGTTQPSAGGPAYGTTQPSAGRQSSRLPNSLSDFFSQPLLTFLISFLSQFANQFLKPLFNGSWNFPCKTKKYDFWAGPFAN